MTTTPPSADPNRVIASLARDQVNLDLKTVDLCFLAGLYLRADKAALASFEEDVLIDLFEQVCDVREDRQPVPAEALRETIINAVIHRDLSLASGYVAIAVFDDRIEVRSVGELPFGLRAEQLSEEHPSKPRNPDLAGAFHRTGAIEVWGRGTNRVIEACRAWGIDTPTFKVEMGVTTVTFHAEIRPGREAEAGGSKSSQRTDLVGDSVTDSVGDPVDRLLGALERGPLATAQLQKALGLKHRPTFKENYLKPALAERLIEMTVPDKPSSRLQKYRLTDAGRARLSTKRGGAS